MLNFYLVVIFLAFFSLRGLLVFCSQHKHLLVTLLSLEYVILRMFVLIILRAGQEIMEAYFSLVFLIFAVSEGAVGLSILTTIARRHGRDYFKRFNLVW